MPSYAEYARDRDLAGRKARQDRYMEQTRRMFDGQVAENTDKRGGWKAMKYERASFAVVGEGTTTANDNFRRGYDAINWS